MNPALKALLAVYGYVAGVVVFTWLACSFRTWYGKKYLGETDETGWE